jgi:hypothetical protein
MSVLVLGDVQAPGRVGAALARTLQETLLLLAPAVDGKVPAALDEVARSTSDVPVHVLLGADADNLVDLARRARPRCVVVADKSLVFRLRVPLCVVRTATGATAPVPVPAATGAIARSAVVADDRRGAWGESGATLSALRSALGIHEVSFQNTPAEALAAGEQRGASFIFIGAWASLRTLPR